VGLCNRELLALPYSRVAKHNESITPPDLSRKAAYVGAKGHAGRAQHREF